MNMWCAKKLHIDGSHKESNHPSKFMGNLLFKALITVTNKFSEIRLQLHVATDDHEQVWSAIEAFKETLGLYG